MGVLLRSAFSVLLLIGAMTGASAWAAGPLPSELRYDLKEAEKEPVALEIRERATQALSRAGFESLDPTHDSTFAWTGADQVFFNPHGAGFVALRYHVKPTQEHHLNQVFEAGDGRVIHVKSREGVYVWMMVNEALADAEIRILASKLQDHLSSRIDIRRAWISDVHAATSDTQLEHSRGAICALRTSPAFTNMEDFLISLSDSPERTQFLRTSFACLKGAKDGAIDGILRPITMVKGAWEALKDPAKFATHVANHVTALMKVLANARAEIEKAVTTFKQLPAEEKSRVTCDVIAGVGVPMVAGTLATIALGPVGAAGTASAAAKLGQIVLKMQGFLARYKSIQGLMGRIKKPGSVAHRYPELRQRFLTRLRELDAKQYEAFKKFYGKADDDFLFRAVACSR